MSLSLDLNADVGESFGVFSIGDDDGVLRSVTSASVAAGYHGGDPSVLRLTIRRAKSHGVAVGAHPGFPDLAGFGRREMHLSPRELEDLVLYQIAAVAGVAVAEGVRLRHVKAHGALYNLAAGDRDVARSIARACAAFDESLILYGPPGSRLIEAGREAGLRTAVEGFADRAYRADGTLVARSTPGSVIHDPDLVLVRAVQMGRDGTVVADDGSILPMAIETLCLHGDTPGAGALAASLRAGLEAAGIRIAAVGTGGASS